MIAWLSENPLASLAVTLGLTFAVACAAMDRARRRWAVAVGGAGALGMALLAVANRLDPDSGAYLVLFLGSLLLWPSLAGLAFLAVAGAAQRLYPYLIAPPSRHPTDPDDLAP